MENQNIISNASMNLQTGGKRETLNLGGNVTGFSFFERGGKLVSQLDRNLRFALPLEFCLPLSFSPCVCVCCAFFGRDNEVH